MGSMVPPWTVQFTSDAQRPSKHRASVCIDAWLEDMRPGPSFRKKEEGDRGGEGRESEGEVREVGRGGRGRGARA